MSHVTPFGKGKSKIIIDSTVFLGKGYVNWFFGENSNKQPTKEPLTLFPYTLLSPHFCPIPRHQTNNLHRWKKLGTLHHSFHWRFFLWLRIATTTFIGQGRAVGGFFQGPFLSASIRQISGETGHWSSKGLIPRKSLKFFWLRDSTKQPVCGWTAQLKKMRKSTRVPLPQFSEWNF